MEVSEPESVNRWADGVILLGQGATVPGWVSKARNEAINFRVVERADGMDQALDQQSCLNVLIPGHDPQFWRWINAYAGKSENLCLTLLVGDADAGACTSLNPIQLASFDGFPDSQQNALEAFIDLYAIHGVYMSGVLRDDVKLFDQPNQVAIAFDIDAAHVGDLIAKLRPIRKRTAGLPVASGHFMARCGSEMFAMFGNVIDPYIGDDLGDVPFGSQYRDCRPGEQAGVRLLLLLN